MRLAQRLLGIKCWDLVEPLPTRQAHVRVQPMEGLFATPCGAGGEGRELHVCTVHRAFKVCQAISGNFFGVRDGGATRS